MIILDKVKGSEENERNRMENPFRFEVSSLPGVEYFFRRILTVPLKVLLTLSVDLVTIDFPSKITYSKIVQRGRGTMSIAKIFSKAWSSMGISIFHYCMATIFLYSEVLRIFQQNQSSVEPWTRFSVWSTVERSIIGTHTILVVHVMSNQQSTN
jgi:hypothetical protein